ncbi:MAG: hypothetical protein QOC56_318, partial [Alphaproteobacteria bacterium]|nr:hypothetical protein [Alphaproteobacteria bacterium]
MLAPEFRPKRREERDGLATTLVTG